MTEAKTVRRFWWLDEWQIEEVESWLSDMAAQGWHIKDSGRSLATFVQGDARKDRYRCDIFKQHHPQFEERLNLYQSAGWDYVCSRGLVHIFRAPDDRSIPEIHTDPQEQSRTMALLVRRLIWGSVVLLAVLLLLILSPFLYQQNLIFEVLVNGNAPHLTTLPVILFVLYLNLRGLAVNFGLYLKLRRGTPLIHNKPYKRSLYLSKAVAIMTFLAAIVLITERLISFVAMVSSDPFPPIPDGTLPVLRLSELTSDVELVPVIIPGFDENIANHYKTDSSLLVPKQWYLKEDVKAPGKTWPGGGYYNPSMEVEMYQARTEWLAQLLAEAMVSQISSRNEGREQLSMEAPSRFDALWRSQEEYYHIVIAQQGRLVIQVRYHGMTKAEQLLNTIMDKMEALE